jgi:hypothetical protein
MTDGSAFELHRSGRQAGARVLRAAVSGASRSTRALKAFGFELYETRRLHAFQLSTIVSGYQHPGEEENQRRTQTALPRSLVVRL